LTFKDDLTQVLLCELITGNSYPVPYGSGGQMAAN